MLENKELMMGYLRMAFPYFTRAEIMVLVFRAEGMWLVKQNKNKDKK
ncbi:MAG: hypothetical protein IIX45_10565 [Lachnospiraceae bacterium]|nr:hypothetical protein [Lachnospiraceae bacterium]